VRKCAFSGPSDVMLSPFEFSRRSLCERVRCAAVRISPFQFRSVWADQPDVHISFQDLSYTLSVPLTDTKVHNLVSAVVDAAKKPFQGKASTTILQALTPTTGLIRPGTMTLILAPPGHGKTTLLKALSGRLSHDSGLTGTVKFNNLTEAENLARGLHVSRLCAYVGQSDLLFPPLTVTETLTYAANSSLPDARLLLQPAPGQPELTPEQKAAAEEVIELDKHRADLLIQMVGLGECASTIVGNDLLRGVSG
jgi:ABC-type multidrug transport system ATPase subunit